MQVLQRSSLRCNDQTMYMCEGTGKYGLKYLDAVFPFTSGNFELTSVLGYRKEWKF